MNETLQPADLEQCAMLFRSLSTELMNTQGKTQAELINLIARGASQSEILLKRQELDTIGGKITEAIQKAQTLDSKAILGILAETDLANAMKAISDANDKVLEALNRIKEVRKALEFVDLFIRLGGAIIGAATTGNPAAQIKKIIEAIDDL
jgi:hypothetical protein